MMTIQAFALVLASLSGEAGRLEGTVLLKGEPPERQIYELDDALRPFHDADVFLDEDWLVGEKGELANVVLTLHRLDLEAPPKPEPLKDAVYAKIGPRYEPRVLIVPVGSEVTLRNVNSPCNGFMGRGQRDQFNMTLQKGSEQRVTLEHRGTIPVSCDLRPMMRGAIVVVDTPYFAKSDATGRFVIPELPAGRYGLRVWHEGLGRVREGLPETVTVAAGEPTRLQLELQAPRPEPAPADKPAPTGK